MCACMCEHVCVQTCVCSRFKGVHASESCCVCSHSVGSTGSTPLAVHFKVVIEVFGLCVVYLFCFVLAGSNFIILGCPRTLYVHPAGFELKRSTYLCLLGAEFKGMCCPMRLS